MMCGERQFYAQPLGSCYCLFLIVIHMNLYVNNPNVCGKPLKAQGQCLVSEFPNATSKPAEHGEAEKFKTVDQVQQRILSLPLH